jgi:uncharacterized protein (TIGR03000 family)
MKRILIWCAVPILLVVVLLALPNTSGAAAMRSGGGSRWGGSFSSPSYYSPYPVYYASFYGVPISGSLARVPAEEDYAYGAFEEIAPNTVLIALRVPANAEISFNGSKTVQTGSLRSFVTPALEPGRDFSYEIRARWMEAGRPVEETRKINFRAGDRMTLNFTR